MQWLRELFAGRYDRDYVLRRWKVGNRHVEIGLDPVFTNVGFPVCALDWWARWENPGRATATVWSWRSSHSTSSSIWTSRPSRMRIRPSIWPDSNASSDW